MTCVRRHRAEFFRALDFDKQQEVLDRVFAGALLAWIAEILEPLDFARREALEPRRIRAPCCAGDWE